MFKILGFALMLLLAACGASEDQGQTTLSEPTDAQILFAEQASPSDPTLRAIYDQSCRLCHSVSTMNAPLTGHGAAWAAREAARGGIEGLLASTKNGYLTMPAMGQCLDCTDEQFLALIEFMAKDGSGS